MLQGHRYTFFCTAAEISQTRCLVFVNLIDARWKAAKSLEIVVSDMTCISHKGTLFEWTLFVDVCNNEIPAHNITNRRGSNLPYYHCLDVLNQIVGLKNKKKHPQFFTQTKRLSIRRRLSPTTMNSIT